MGGHPPKNLAAVSYLKLLANKLKQKHDLLSKGNDTLDNSSYNSQTFNEINYVIIR